MCSNVVECDLSERERQPEAVECVCKGGPTLAILQEVQRGYEERMALIERLGGANKLQMQVEVLRGWVGDLSGQNTLLARAVEELEAEATSRLLLEKRRHSEIVCELRAEREALRRRLARKDSDLRGLVEVLRRLRESDYCTLDGIHFFEITESQIFGSPEWRQEKLEDGDGVGDIKRKHRSKT
ncbi:unnamed protein product [Chilo suppressalis]|uniref:Uncharacterized protein n=1 Tax=Chilo suppressalis TaxID=168631 RepID=A0ABN8B971_CHISP|nr:unnamed protein product [Chilo suppressalis]